ncbi:MAG: prolyl aminopeptidase [Alphaproteobacteria bacterium]|nr:prolyl aminopeptidase [Alphaproteobacteria bacterium]
MSTKRKTLFPEIQPYSTGFLDVTPPHSLYWEQSGNPDGVPVIFVHGGPGAGTTPKQRRYFNPDHYRIILLDQRGAGKSQPHACIEHNTLPDLVADMEALRAHLNIPRWHVFGGSWGSTLSLAYAQAHPDRCLSLVLRGIFLCEQAEIDWFVTPEGMGRIFPEAYEKLASFIPKSERDDLSAAYYRRLMDDDEALAQEAAQYWCEYEGSCAALLPRTDVQPDPEEQKHNLSLARMEAHYFRNNVIPPEKSLLKGVDKIRHIPAVIVQGRYDMVCPIATAHKLHKAWPEADYIVVPDAGHAGSEPGTLSRLIEATENMKTIKP